MATMPPLRREASAARTTSPLGAKVTAESSGTGGRSVASPTQVAPSVAGQLLVRGAAGGDVDFAVPGFEDVDGEVRRGAEAEEADTIAGGDFGHAQAAEADDAGAEQRGEVGGGLIFGERDEEVGASDGVFGIAAVDGVAGVGGMVAEIFAVLAAEGAGAIDATEPGDSGAVADADRVDARAELFDARDNLVAGCDDFAQGLEFARGDVEIGAADAAGFNLEQHLAGAGLGDGQVFEGQRMRSDGGGMVEDSGAHHFQD